MASRRDAYSARKKSGRVKFSFSRNMKMKDIRFDREDKLEQLFSEVQYDIYEAVELNPSSTLDNKHELNGDPQTQISCNDLSAQDIPENSFAIRINQNGSLELYVVVNGGLHQIQNHVGRFDALLSYARSKSESNRDEDSRKNSEISRQYLYCKVPKDGEPSPKYNVDSEKFIEDYISLIAFCFDWIGKEPNDDFQVQNDIFKVKDKDEKILGISSSKMQYKIEDVLIKYFECVRDLIGLVTNPETSNVVILYGDDANFTPDAKEEIKMCIRKAKLHIAHEIDPLTRLFNNVQSTMDRDPFGINSENVPNERGILDRDLSDERTCGIQIDSNGNVTLTIMRDNRVHEIRNHIGEIDRLKTQAFTGFTDIISFAFKYFTKTDPDLFVENQPSFKVVDNDPISISIENALETYKLDDILTAYFEYVLKVLSNYDSKINRIVLACSGKFTTEQKSCLIKCINTSFSRSIIIDVDIIEQLFNKMQNQLTPTIKNAKKDECLTYQRILSEDMKNNVSLILSLSGECDIVLYEKDHFKFLTDHIGSIKSVKADARKGYKELLSVCLKLLTRSHKGKETNYKLFTITNKKELKIKLNDCDNEHDAIQILKSFFQYMNDSLKSAKPDTYLTAVLAAPFEYGEGAITELQECIQNSDFQVVKTVIGLEQFFNILENQVKTDSSVYETQKSYPFLTESLAETNIWGNKHMWGMELEICGKLSMGFLNNGIYQTVKKHIGTWHSDVINSELYVNILNELKSLVGFLMTTFWNIAELNYNNTGFQQLEIASTNPATIKFKSSSHTYTAGDALGYYFKSIMRCVSRAASAQDNKVIAALSGDIVQEEFEKLKVIMENAGFQIVSQINEIDSYFNKVLNQMPKPRKLQTNKLPKGEKVTTVQSLVDTDISGKNTFGLEIYDNGKIGVCVVENKKNFTIVDHLGDMDNVIEKNKDINVDDFKKLNSIIQSSIRHMGGVDLKGDSDFIEVSKKDPSKLVFKNSGQEFNPAEVYKRLLKHLSEAVTSEKNQAKNLVQVASPELNFKTLEPFENAAKDLKLNVKKSIDGVQQLFNRVQNQLNKIPADKGNSSSKDTNVFIGDLDNTGAIGLTFNPEEKCEAVKVTDGKSKCFDLRIGSLENIIKTHKDKIEDVSSFETLSSLLNYCFSTLSNDPSKISKNLKGFQVSEKDPKKVLLNNSTAEYDTDYILQLFFDSLCRDLNAQINEKDKEIILDVPDNYDATKIEALKKYFETRGYKVKKVQNSLEKLFNKVMNICHIDPNKAALVNGITVSDDGNQKTEGTSKPTKDTDDIEFDEKKVFTVELKNNGDSSLGSMVDNSFIDVDCPLGVPTTDLIKKYCKSKEEEMLINTFKTLIESSFKSITMSNDNIDESSGLFKVVNKNPFKFRLKGSDKEYTQQDVMRLYFLWMAKCVCMKTGAKPKLIAVSCPPEYGVLEKTDLKNSLEAAGFKVTKIVTVPVGKAIALTNKENEMEKPKENTKNILLDWNSGPLSVTLFENNVKSDKIAILASFLGKNTKMIETEVLNSLKRILFQHTDFKNEDQAMFISYVNEILDKFKQGEEEVTIEVDGRKITVNKSELEKHIIEHVAQSCELIEATLKEYNITPENIGKVDFCYDSILNSIISEYIQAYLDELHINFDRFNTQNEVNYRNKFTEKVSEAITADNDEWMETLLGFNFGIEIFGGIFDVLLKRGTPIKNGKLEKTNTYNTMQDNQDTATVIVFRGERPFVRYCEKLGQIKIQDIPKRPVGSIKFSITFEVDANETLNIEVQYTDVITNQKSEKFKLFIDRSKASKASGNENLMIVDKVKFEKEDQALKVKVIDIDHTIQRVRAKYRGTEQYNNVSIGINSLIAEVSTVKNQITEELCDGFKQRLAEY